MFKLDRTIGLFVNYHESLVNYHRADLAFCVHKMLSYVHKANVVNIIISHNL